MKEFLETCGNPGRGAHRFALNGARKIFAAREHLAEFFGIRQSERLIFTGGCTSAINMVIKGLALKNVLQKGDVVVVSSLEHNAVMRPLNQLRETIGISFAVCPAGDKFEEELAALVDRHFPKLVILNWASNVTGEVLPVERVAPLLKAKGIPLLVDGAQVAAKLPIALDESQITFFCASGHKGLMGAPGAGLLYLAPEADLPPLISGGTGSRSESLEFPMALPDRLEAGTLPGPAIVSLSAGLSWLQAEGMDRVLASELALTENLLKFLRGKERIKVFGPLEHPRLPIVSFSIQGLSPADVASELDTKYGIAVRAGLHCAAVCHESLGTLDTGLVRVSFGFSNRQEELDRLCSALDEMAS